MQDWLKQALRSDNPAAKGRRSDFDLNRHITLKNQRRAVRQAAVLVPVIDYPSEAKILLTKRTETLSSHAGQVSFPGGKIDESDENAVSAALREAEEEVGLSPDLVNVCGFLDTYRTGTGFEITPVVGLVDPGFELVIQEEEVESVFEVPLSFFLDRKNHERHSKVWQGLRREYYAMPFGDYYIWGATAAMLVNLIDVLDETGELVR